MKGFPMDDLHIKRQHHITARISVFIVRTKFQYSMLTEIKDLETLELFDSIVFDANYLKAGGKVTSIIGMPYKPYSYLMEQYVVCFRKLTIFSVGNKTVMDKLSVGVMTQLDKLYNQCYKTPAALVNDILDRLPLNTWTNPDKTFLDPACGTGEFIVQVQKRLMVGLVMIPEKERLDYINKNMLYYNDINNNWVEWTRFRLGGGNGFNENFMDWEPDMKFDLVLGNPPYQAPTKGDYSYWARFVKQSDSLLKLHGLLSLIIPQGYLSPTNDIRRNTENNNMGESVLRDILAKNWTKEIVLTSDIGEHFKGVGSSFSYFIMKKIDHDTQLKTKIVLDDETIELSLTDLFYLPKGRINSKVISIFTKVHTKTKTKMNWVRKAVREENKVYCSDKTKTTQSYKLINGNSKYIENLWWGDTKPENYDTPKVIVPRNGEKFKFFFDKGEHGYCDTSVYLLDENEKIANVEQFLSSKLVKFILPLNTTEKYTQYNDTAYLRFIPKMDFSRSWTDQEIYQYFNLTEEEILYIEQTVK